MNITSQIAARIGGELEELINNTPEIQFYVTYNPDRYKWRDGRFKSSCNIDYNPVAESRAELIDLFERHIEDKRGRYTLQDILDAVQYGFDYRVESMNDGKSVPLGNTLQYLMWSKKLKVVPEEFKELLYKFNLKERE